MFNRIYIEITNICNLKCSFCPITTRNKEFMSVSNFEVVLSKIKNYTKHIYLHVKGEPLMHPNLDEILKLANAYDLNVNITTNARLLKDKIDILNNNKIRQINISLHSFNSVNEIKELLPNVDKLKCYVSLRLWNNKDNTEIYKLLESYYNKKIDLSSNRFSLSDKVFLSIEKLFDWPDINNEIISEYGTCKGGKRQLAILVDGTIVPCCLDNEGIINLGNIFESSIQDILNTTRYKELINGFNNNKLNEELCKKCGYRNKFN